MVTQMTRPCQREKNHTCIALLISGVVRVSFLAMFVISFIGGGLRSLIRSFRVTLARVALGRTERSITEVLWSIPVVSGRLCRIPRSSLIKKIQRFRVAFFLFFL